MRRKTMDPIVAKGRWDAPPGLTETPTSAKVAVRQWDGGSSMRTSICLSLALSFSAAITLADAAEFCNATDAVATAVSGDLVDLTNQRKLASFTDGARKNA